MGEMSPQTRETLSAAQKHFAEVDPSILEMDLEDPETALMLLIMTAFSKGSSIQIISETDEGASETLELETLATAGSEAPTVAATFGSSTGKLSAETAEMVSDLMTTSLDTEIKDLLQ